MLVLLLAVAVDLLKPPRRDGHIVIQAEAHRFLGLSVVPGRAEHDKSSAQNLRPTKQHLSTHRTIAKPFLIVPSATALHISITPPHDRRAA